MCWKCGRAIETKPGFRDTCPSCGKELHVCRNCAFYYPGAHYDCREPQADQVMDKERMNLCEYWRVKKAGGGAKEGSDKGGASAKDAFERLFGG